jgi:protein-S-isoprenylcysteine O-methyltransferase Ste14
MLRHLLAILLLPFVVVAVLPFWLLTAFAGADTRWATGSLLVWLARPAGILLFGAGLALFGWCMILFARVGKGTLAPWDPTRNLVAAGPYRYVRNPMIAGVGSMLVGEALFWGSALLGAWAGFFLLLNHVYFIFSEEPGLEQRFGEEYRAYKEHVPRWIPRRRPWKGK